MATLPRRHRRRAPGSGRGSQRHVPGGLRLARAPHIGLQAEDVPLEIGHRQDRHEASIGIGSMSSIAPGCPPGPRTLPPPCGSAECPRRRGRGRDGTALISRARAAPSARPRRTPSATFAAGVIAPEDLDLIAEGVAAAGFDHERGAPRPGRAQMRRAAYVRSRAAAHDRCASPADHRPRARSARRGS